MVFGACSNSGQIQSSGSSIDLGIDDIELVSNLVPFSNCDELLSHLKQEAKERVGPYGLSYQGGPWWWGEPEMMRADDMVMMEDSAMTTGATKSDSGSI